MKRRKKQIQYAVIPAHKRFILPLLYKRPIMDEEDLVESELFKAQSSRPTKKRR